MTHFILLKARRFMPLFLTQFLGALNDNIFKNALIILLTYQTIHFLGLSGEGLVAMAAGLFILPFLLFSASAGQLAEKYEKSRLISIIKLIEITLMMMAAIGFYTHNLFILMLVLFCLGTHAAFFGPLKYSILPELLEEHELVAGNGYIESATFLSILIGTIVSGILINKTYGIYVISIIVISISLLGWLCSLFIPKIKMPLSKSYSIQLNIYKDTLALLKFSQKSREIFLCILGISWFWSIGATLLSEFPVFIKEILHGHESIITLFLTLFSLGLMIGSVLCNKLLKGMIHTGFVSISALAMSICLLDLSYTAASFNHTIIGLLTIKDFIFNKQGMHIILDLIFLAIASGIYVVPLYAMLQKKNNHGDCSKIIASNNVMNALFMVVTSLIIMGLSKIGMTVIHLFFILSLGSLFVAVFAFKQKPEIIITLLFKGFLKLFYRVELKGLENYHASGEKTVIIANHTSLLDAVLLATFLPDKLTFAVNKNIAKKWWVKMFLSLVDAYPMDPSNPMLIKTLVEKVKNNHRCVIFPEGRLSMTGSLMKIYEGPGMIADKARANVLAIRIDGAERSPFSYLKEKSPISIFPKITISILAPQKINVSEEFKGKQRRKKINIELYDLMTHLMFQTSDFDKTLFSSLLETYHLYGAKHKILEDASRAPMSFYQLILSCTVLGQRLSKMTNVKENIGILLPNINQAVVTFFALQAHARVPAMLNYSSGVNNILLTIQSANIQHVITSRKFITLAKLEHLVDAFISKNIEIYYLEDISKSITFSEKIIGMLQARFPKVFYRKNTFSSSDPAVILFTSGSEGAPKGVVLSHQNLLSNCAQLKACIDINKKDKVFNALPLFHSFGLTGGMLLPLLSGVNLFLYPSPLHYKMIPELSYDTNATILFGTDTFLANYGKHANPYDFYSIRYVFAGAEKLKEETRSLWSQKFGIRIFEGYGVTECSPVIAMNTPMHNKQGTVGRLLPGISHRMNPVEGIDEGYELTVNGPNIMSGYLLTDQPGILKSLEQPWYATGDIVSIDHEGFIKIIGRLKRFAKIAGEMVSLTMVEMQISALWDQYDHAIVSLPDAKKGEQLVLVTTHQEASRDELMAYAKKIGLNEIAIPKKIIHIPEMLLLGSGKKDYIALKKIAYT